MPFDEAEGHGGGDGRRDVLRDLAMATIGAFDQKVEELNLCEACATRVLLQEVMTALLIIGHVHGASPEKMAGIITDHLGEAQRTIETLKRAGML